MNIDAAPKIEQATSETSQLEEHGALVTITSLNAEFSSLIMTVCCILNSATNLWDNVVKCKEHCSFLKISDSSNKPLFSCKEISRINDCKDFCELLRIINLHLSWDEHSILMQIVSECQSECAQEEIERFAKKLTIYDEIEILFNASECSPPPEFEKFCVVINKPYKQLTKSEYEEVKEFIFEHLDTKCYVTNNYMKMLSDSLHLVWHVTVQAIPHMITMAHRRKVVFIEEHFTYMRIGNATIIDCQDSISQLSSEEECNAMPNDVIWKEIQPPSIDQENNEELIEDKLAVDEVHPLSSIEVGKSQPKFLSSDYELVPKNVQSSDQQFIPTPLHGSSITSKTVKQLPQRMMTHSNLKIAEKLQKFLEDRSKSCFSLKSSILSEETSTGDFGQSDGSSSSSRSESVLFENDDPFVSLPYSSKSDYENATPSDLGNHYPRALFNNYIAATQVINNPNALVLMRMFDNDDLGGIIPDRFLENNPEANICNIRKKEMFSKPTPFTSSQSSVDDDVFIPSYNMQRVIDIKRKLTLSTAAVTRATNYPKFPSSHNVSVCSDTSEFLFPDNLSSFLTSDPLEDIQDEHDHDSVRSSEDSNYLSASSLVDTETNIQPRCQRKRRLGMVLRSRTSVLEWMSNISKFNCIMANKAIQPISKSIRKRLSSISSSEASDVESYHSCLDDHSADGMTEHDHDSQCNLKSET